MALTPLQKRFVEEYPGVLNATEAYKRAGGKAKGHSAESQGSRLMSVREVKEAIDKALLKLATKAGATAEEVIQGIRRLAFWDIRKLYRSDGRLKLPSEWDDDTADAVTQVEAEDETPVDKRGRIVARTTKVRLCDKLKARELMGRITGVFKDEAPATNVNVSIGVPLDPSKLNDDQLRQLATLLDAAAGPEPPGGSKGG